MRSRAKTIRRAGSEVLGQPHAATPAMAGVPGARPPGSVLTQQPQPGTLSHPNGQPGGRQLAATGTAIPRRNSRRQLRNWRVRSRLLLLIIIPTASAIALGGISIAASVRNALTYQRAQQLAGLGKDLVELARGLADERDQTVVYIAMPKGTGGRTDALAGNGAKAALQLAVIQRQQRVTNVELTAVRDLLGQINGGYSPQAQQAAAVALTAINGLTYLRQAAVSSKLPALVAVQKYTQLIDDVLAMDNQIAQASNDPAIAQTVQVLGLVTAMQEQASEQRAILTAALLRGRFGPGELAAFQAAQSAQQSNLNAFNVSANVQQHQIWDTSVSRSQAPLVSEEVGSALALASAGKLHADPTTGYEWYGAMSSPVDVQIASVAHQLTAAIIARAAVLRRQAITSALIVGAAVLLILIVALILTMIIGRSMVRPLRRLRAGALDVAGVRLPETVRRMSETDAENIPLDVDPIDVDSLDEVGEVARAFDQVHREAIRLAANEAALRGNVNAMFVNLSRRSQSLVERQLRLIDDLEQGEQDSERLGSLFQMDHLATRMRRNSENLLVLAGHESSRRWNQPVPLVDVLRAAISEIEQYERVTLNVQPGIAVRGPAVNDVVHLIAELAENATSFSSAETPVSVSGHLLSSGGVLLDITDSGVGMDAEEMAHANWRLDNPPVVDVAVSRRMGLFVVARLAARHGIRVRLRSATGPGLTALVWLPDEVVSRESVGRAAGPGWLAEAAGAPAIEPGLPQRPSGRVGIRGGDWTEPGWGPAEEAATARTPRFTPVEAVGENGSAGAGAGLPGTAAAGPLGPQRVPGAGPHPGQAGITTGPIPVVGETPEEPTWLSEPAGEPVLGAPVAEAPPASDILLTHSYPFRSADSDVIVPPAASLREENRLPIFEAVESDWFRRGRPSMDWHSSKASGTPLVSWASPGDEGWRAAEHAVAPSSGGTTSAGLPRRVPRANLIPGTAADAIAQAPAPARSAAATRERFASLQRGMREGRAASAAGKAGEGEEVPGDG